MSERIRHDEIECLKCGHWVKAPAPGRSTSYCPNCNCCHGLDAFVECSEPKKDVNDEP